MMNLNKSVKNLNNRLDRKDEENRVLMRRDALTDYVIKLEF